LYTYYKYFEKVYIFKPISSNPIEWEFYIIGKRFKTIEKSWMNNFFDKLKNFKVDIIINENIPKNFENSVNSILLKLAEFKNHNFSKDNL